MLCRLLRRPLRRLVVRRSATALGLIARGLGDDEVEAHSGPGVGSGFSPRDLAVPMALREARQ